VQCWDLRKNEEEYVMEAHKDTVTGLALSPDGSYLLSNGMDNTGMVWG
jgi:Prp8 binding protein